MAKTTNRSMTSKRQNRTKNRESNGEPQGSELHELFLDELADLYSAEHQLLKALPKMAKVAESDQLRDAFETHRQETEGQISRLEKIARSLDETIKRKKCKAMEGLIEEAKDMMDEKKDSPALDAALISCAQKVEHYEIASYGTLCAWAKLMRHSEALQLLQTNLREEEATDEKLTEIAETVANIEGEKTSHQAD